MIKNRDIAKQIVDLMLQFGARIDQSVELVQSHGTEEELTLYRRAAGAVMGEMLIEVLNPIFEQHPELTPAQLRETAEKDRG